MFRNNKIWIVIVSLSIIFTCSYLVIALMANSPVAPNPSVSAMAKENNILELGFPGVKEPLAVHHSIIVEKATVCLGVKDRLPVQECQRINSDAGKIFCWSILINGEGKKVRYIWYIGEKVLTSSWLNITSNRLRAWCPRNIDSRIFGQSRVDIVDEQGRILKSIEFEIIPRQERGNAYLKYS